MKFFPGVVSALSLVACAPRPATPEGDPYQSACDKIDRIRQGEWNERVVQETLADLDQAIETAPDDYRAYYARAMVYASAARYKEAAQDLLVCVQAQDKSIKRKAHRRLAQIYDEKFEDLKPESLRHYELYLQMGADDPESRRRAQELKKAELERGDLDDPDQAHLKILESARLAAASGRHEESVELLSQILSRSSLSEEQLRAVKDLYIKERLALETERKAGALFEAALDMIKDGKVEQARGVLEDLVRRYADTPAAKQAMRKLLELGR
jgi:tetratricopeptide (TPR) repeat protein